ncbi:MAG: DoxX family protein [Arachnia propionica]|nr:MAG: DoxX family protein [Arachnia propionica]
MSLLRFAARSLFASYFVYNGVKTFKAASDHAEDAERFTAKAIPLAQRVVPSEFSSYIPQEAITWVRGVSAMQVVGGFMFATGIGRRLGAFMLAAASAHNVVVAAPEKGATGVRQLSAKPETMKHVALLGAALLATQDLQGKPSLGWRRAQLAKKSKQEQGKTSAAAAKQARAQRKAKRLARLSRRATRQAQAATKSAE